MKKIKFNLKKNWKNILSAVLAGVLLFGAVSAAVGILNKDTKTISSTAFAVGGINDQGNYVESETSIYTKDMFECQGLSIEPDFEATGTYQVFYYDNNKNFVGATDELKAEDGVYNKADTYVFAKYARIMITPAVPTDDDGYIDEDFKIRFYEVAGYASDYTITVNKKQKFEVENYFLVDSTKVGMFIDSTGNTVGSALVFKTDETRTYNSSQVVDCKDWRNVEIQSSEGKLHGNYCFVDASGNYLAQGKQVAETVNEDGYAVMVIEVPENACGFIMCYKSGDIDNCIYPR